MEREVVNVVVDMAVMEVFFSYRSTLIKRIYAQKYSS